jgi:chromosome segregation ATPase
MMTLLIMLHQDVSRLQIEKKEAEAAGKSFFEQYKELKKASQANESALLVEVEQDLSAAQMDYKKSQETVAKLEEQVAKLQAELQVQSAEAIKGSTENVEVQQQLAKLQSELDRSKEEVNELHARITSKDDELAKAREAAESLEHDIKSGKSESDEVS